MAARDEIVSYLDGLLHPDQFEDLGPNGLQIPGSEAVDSIVCGVSGHLELFQRARDLGAQMVLVHHGILWDFLPRRVSIQMAKRFKALLEADINLVAYHLPLDAHREVGNNALLCRGLGLTLEEQQFGVYQNQPIGCVGSCKQGLGIDELSGSIEQLTDSEPLVFSYGPREIKRVGVVTGAGSKSIQEAVELGLDAFVTGEPAEHAMADAREGGIHFIAAGHYNTEKLGVQRLGEMLAEKFGITQSFVDIPNPV